MMCQVWWRELTTGVVGRGEIIDCKLAYWVANEMMKQFNDGQLITWVIQLHGA